MHNSRRASKKAMAELSPPKEADTVPSYSRETPHQDKRQRMEKVESRKGEVVERLHTVQESREEESIESFREVHKHPQERDARTKLSRPSTNRNWNKKSNQTLSESDKIKKVVLVWLRRVVNRVVTLTVMLACNMIAMGALVHDTRSGECQVLWRF